MFDSRSHCSVLLPTSFLSPYPRGTSVARRKRQRRGTAVCSRFQRNVTHATTGWLPVHPHVLGRAPSQQLAQPSDTTLIYGAPAFWTEHVPCHGTVTSTRIAREWNGAQRRVRSADAGEFEAPGWTYRRGNVGKRAFLQYRPRTL